MNLGYDRNSIRRYGFDSTDAGFSKADVLRNFEDWNGSFKFNRLRNKKKAPQLGFLIDYHSFGTSDKSKETSIEGVLDFRMRAFEGEILADLSAMHTKVNTTTGFQERVFLDFFPRYTFKHPTEDLDINAGFRVTYVPNGVDSNLLIFPHLEGRYHLIKDYIVIFGGFTGGLDKTLLRTQVYNNPFIADTFRIHRTTASAIVTKYKKKKPSNLIYNLSKKKYVKGYTFERVFLMNERSLLYLNAIDVIYSS